MSSCQLQDGKWYIKVFLQIADFTVHKHKMQYIRPGHSNPLANFFGDLEQLNVCEIKAMAAFFFWTGYGYCKLQSISMTCDALHVPAMQPMPPYSHEAEPELTLMQTKCCKTCLPARQHILLGRSCNRVGQHLALGHCKAIPNEHF